MERAVQAQAAAAAQLAAAAGGVSGGRLAGLACLYHATSGPACGCCTHDARRLLAPSFTPMWSLCRRAAICDVRSCVRIDRGGPQTAYMRQQQAEEVGLLGGLQCACRRSLVGEECAGGSSDAHDHFATYRGAAHSPPLRRPERVGCSRGLHVSQLNAGLASCYGVSMGCGCNVAQRSQWLGRKRRGGSSGGHLELQRNTHELQCRCLLASAD